MLALAAIANGAGYYTYDSIAPVADLLHRETGFSYAEIGALTGICSLPNIALGLCGGLLADRYGPARVALWSMALATLGTILTAAGPAFWIMACGRLLFGAGAGAAFVALLVGVGHWFVGARLGVAMALYLSLARLGSYLADLAPQLAKPVFDSGWQAPLWLAAGVCGTGFLAAAVYRTIEFRQSGRSSGITPRRFNWSVLAGVDPAFWHLLAMSTAFYAVVFPFRSTFSIEYFQNAKGLSLQQAGITNSWVFLAAIFATPMFGWLADRSRHQTALMALGMLALATSFAILGATAWPLWITTVLVGLGYSLIPAILWPAMARIVDLRRLGTAVGLVTILQEFGMFICNVVVGQLNDWGHAGRAHPSGYQPMLWFFGLLSATGLVTIATLWMREPTREKSVS